MSAHAFTVTILAALLAVLTLASVAWAGCAWVLWEWVGGAGGYREEYRVEATATQVGCWWSAYRSARKQGEFGSKPEPDWKWTIKGTRTGYAVGPEKAGHQIARMEWSCWPDSVDPRDPSLRPKGSGR
jgi:hypothetical protein